MAIENAKTLNVRIRNKYDSYENWAASSLVLEAGEIAIAHTTVDVKVDNGTAKHPALLMKVGNGTDTFANLPWLSAKAADVLDACKSTDALTTFVNNVIASAGIASSSAMEALTGRVSTAEGEIDVLQADLNTAETGLKARVTTAEAAIAALDELVGDDKVSDQITAAINALNLSTTYEAKGEAAKVQTALETYKTSNDAAVLANTNNITSNTNAINAIKDGTTLDSFADVEAALAGKETSGAAAQALIDAKAYADGLAGNYDAKGAAATAESNAKTYAKEYADGLAGNYDASGSAAQALTDAKDYTDSEFTRLVGDKTVGTQISEAITGLNLANTYDAKGAAAAVEAKLTTHASEAAAAYETKNDASAKLTEAKGYTDTEVAKVQDEVDALETYVGTIPTDEAYKDITDVVGYINKKAEETLAAASGNSTETAASVKQQLDNYKSENNTRVKAAEDAIDAIEADYLKAADKTELQDQITELDGLVGDKKVSEQITDVTNPLDARVKAVEDDYLKASDKTELDGKIKSNTDAIALLTNGVDPDTVDGVNDLIAYVAEHGTEVTGIKADIKANTEAIDAIEKDYLKAADKEELSGAINGVAADVETLDGEVAKKASASDLTSLTNRVSAVEGDLNTAETGLKARMTAAETAIGVLDGLVGDETVSKQIADVTNPLAERIVELEKVDHDHTNKTVLDGISAEKVAAWDKVSEKANDADLAAIAKTGSTDDLIQGAMTLVFDCGGAGV